MKNFISKLFNCKKSSKTFPVTEYICHPDFGGDMCFFDSRHCFVGENPYYVKYAESCEGNEIIKNRLVNYQSPERVDHMVMKRNSPNGDCLFECYMLMYDYSHTEDVRYKYFKLEGDFKFDAPGSVTFTCRDNRESKNYLDPSVTIESLGNPDYMPGYDDIGKCCDTVFSIDSTGAVSGGGKEGKAALSDGKVFHLLWALNLDTKTADVYIDGEKILSDMDMNGKMEEYNLFRVALEGEKSELYIHNFNVTGLIKPIVDGVETKTRVIPDDTSIISFMEGKIGMHAYGNTLVKNCVKTELSTKGIYDKETEEYYVSSDTLSKAFDLNLSDADGRISGDITILPDGEVVLPDGTSFSLEYKPIEKDSRLFVPVKQFAKDALGKYVFWFKTGILLFTDYEMTLDTSGWIYQNMRNNSSAAGCTRWNDIDYLNAYLQYIRPGKERLMNDYIKKMDDPSFTKHPRLFVTNEEFKKMKQNYEADIDPVFTKAVKNYIKLADEAVENKNLVPYYFKDHMRNYSGIDLVNQFTTLGIAYNLTGDKKYADLAFSQFEEIDRAYPDFNTAHVIDAGQALRGVAIGYDWFYNGFTPEQREFAINTIHKHFYTTADAFYGRLTSTSHGALEWRSIKVMSNYNAIVNSGITLSAIATIEHNPDLMFNYINESLRSMEYTMQMFPPDGAWTEGLEYLNFVMQSIVPWSACMDSAFGSSYNVMDGQGMAGILDFMLACIGTVCSNNMSDNDMLYEASCETFFYFARKYNKPKMANMRWADLHNGKLQPTFSDFIFYNFDAIKCEDNKDNELALMQYFKGNELYSIRDTYDREKSDLYFSAHFGTTTGYHQHWDCGSFVLDLMGKRWAFDLGKENYLLQNEKGYLGYEIFRKRCEAHNMLVINPRKYTDRIEIEIENSEFAPILDARGNENGGYVYADMSTVYEDAPKMLLGYLIDDNKKSVTMRNEFTISEDRECVWNLITKGDITIDGNVAYAEQDGKAIKLEFICSGKNARWEDNGNPKPFPETISEEKFAPQKKNEEYSQLRLMFDAPKGDVVLSVKISPKDMDTKPLLNNPISDWKLS